MLTLLAGCCHVRGARQFFFLNHDCPKNKQVGPDPYWGAAGLVGVSAAAPVTVLDNNTVDATFGGISLVTFGQAAGLPAALYGKSAARQHHRRAPQLALFLVHVRS